MDPTAQIVFWWAAFAATHSVLSHPPIRGALVGRLGESPFLGLYSLVALATFVPLVWTFFANRAARGVPLKVFVAVPGLRWVTMILMLVAVGFLVLSFVRPNPVSPFLGRGSGAAGALRITRHPLFVSFAIFGFAHLLVNPAPIDRAFFGGMLVYSLVGAAHQDWRKRRTGGAEMRRFFAETSLVPFLAIALGRNRLELRELPLPAIVAAVALYVVILAAHHRLFT